VAIVGFSPKFCMPSLELEIASFDFETRDFEKEFARLKGQMENCLPEEHYLIINFSNKNSQL